MSDPLSVAASIVGLVSAGAQMITILYNVGSAIKDAPDLTRAASNEIADITVVLQQLQAYVMGKARASIQRLNLITVEHITATLTGCVVTYSELDAVLKSLNAETGMRAWDRGMWYLKKDKVNDILLRLQNHKSTLGLMLNILQWYVVDDCIYVVLTEPQQRKIDICVVPMPSVVDAANPVQRFPQ